MIRIGVLGAARITKGALTAPARRVDGVEIVAIAARDPLRATSAARRHGISRVHPSYDALLGDDSLDAVYIPLPAALHGAWTVAAIRAGKHVLVEKPFAANHAEARAIAEEAARSGRVVMEAHPTSHHPFTSRLAELVRHEEFGRVVSADAAFRVPIPPGRDIRWDVALGGGALMDVGCYPLRLLRDILGADPQIVSASAHTQGEIDRDITARLTYGAVDARVRASIWSPRLFAAHLELRTSAARIRVSWPYHPQQGGRIRVDGPGVRVRERADPKASYDFQLEAFRDAVHGGTNATDSTAAAETLRVIDDIYRAAGMRVREPFRVTKSEDPQ